MGLIKQNHSSLFFRKLFSTTLINAVLFQAVWWLCMLGLSDIAAGCIVLLVVQYIVTTRNLKADVLMLVTVFFSGVLFDVIWVKAGLYSLPESLQSDWLPIWLIFLWIGFSLTVRRSLKWFLVRPLLFPLLCTVLGPLAYYAGEQFGMIVLRPYAWIAMAAQWCCIGIFAVYMQHTFDPVPSEPVSQ